MPRRSKNSKPVKSQDVPGAKFENKQPKAQEQATKAVQKKSFHLPVEVWVKILSSDNLTVKDFKNVRLVCRTAAKAGFPRAFETFVFRRDRRDFERIGQMLTPDPIPFARDVRGIRFESGWLDPQSFAQNFSRALFVSFRKSEGPRTAVQKAFDSPLRQRGMEEYLVRYNKIVEFQQNYQDSEALESLLLKLPKLERIDVTRKSTTANHKWLRKIENESQSWRTLWDQTNRELNTLMCVLKKHNELKKEADGYFPWQPIHHFTHDKVPVTFFANAVFTRNFGDATRNLHTLHLSLDALEPPAPAFWVRFGAVISSCTQLRDLRFGFQSNEATGNWTNLYNPIESRLWYPKSRDTLLDNTIPAFYVPLWKVFEKSTWPHLESLQLDGLSLCENGIEQLVANHPTIRKVVLTQIALLHGTWSGLLTKLRKSKLDDFLVYGRIISVHGEDPCRRFYMEDWDIPAPRESWKSSPVRDAPGIRVFLEKEEDFSWQSAEALRDFVLSDEDLPWPILPKSKFDWEEWPNGWAPNNFISGLMRHIYCASQRDGSCIPDVPRLEMTWNMLSSRGLLPRWESTQPLSHLPQDLSTIGPIFNGRGWDANGHDVKGFNIAGVHYSDLKNVHDADPESLHNALVRKTIEDMRQRLIEIRSTPPTDHEEDQKLDSATDSHHGAENAVSENIYENEEGWEMYDMRATLEQSEDWSLVEDRRKLKTKSIRSAPIGTSVCEEAIDC